MSTPDKQPPHLHHPSTLPTQVQYDNQATGVSSLRKLTLCLPTPPTNKSSPRPAAIPGAELSTSPLPAQDHGIGGREKWSRHFCRNDPISHPSTSPHFFISCCLQNHTRIFLKG